MKIVYNHTELVEYLHKINRVSFDHPLLLEHFIDDAIEIDVDAVCDGTEVIICGVMEHVLTTCRCITPVIPLIAFPRFLSWQLK